MEITNKRIVTKPNSVLKGSWRRLGLFVGIDETDKVIAQWRVEREAPLRIFLVDFSKICRLGSAR